MKKTFINMVSSYNAMATTVKVNRQAIHDLLKVKDDFDSIVESLELISDKEFMKSYQRTKEQIMKRKFVDWNGL